MGKPWGNHKRWVEAHRKAAKAEPHGRGVHLVGQALVRGAGRRQIWQGPPGLCGGAHRGGVGDVVRVDAVIDAAAACTHQKAIINDPIKIFVLSLEV